VNERRVSEGSVLDTLPCDETTGWPIRPSVPRVAVRRSVRAHVRVVEPC